MNHIMLSNYCSSHTLHPSIHTYFRRIREQCHLPPVTSHDLSSAQLHRFRIDSTQHSAQKGSVLGPGTPVTKANSEHTHHSNRTKWQVVVLGRDRRYPKQHTQHGDTSSSHSAADKESSILAYDAVSINYWRFGDLAVSIFRPMPSSPWATTLKMEKTKSYEISVTK